MVVTIQYMAALLGLITINQGYRKQILGGKALRNSIESHAPN